LMQLLDYQTVFAHARNPLHIRSLVLAITPVCARNPASETGCASGWRLRPAYRRNDINDLLAVNPRRFSTPKMYLWSASCSALASGADTTA
jgi:hypothetical protein